MEKGECNCPEISDEEWHLQEFDWSGKIFYFEDVVHLAGMPLGLEKKQQAMLAEIERKGYTVVNQYMVMHQPGTIKGKILVEIEDPGQYDANVIQFDNVRIFTRVYGGPSRGLKNAVEELKAFTQDRAHVPPGAIYYWRITCSKCAKQRGGEKTVLMSRV